MQRPRSQATGAPFARFWPVDVRIRDLRPSMPAVVQNLGGDAPSPVSPSSPKSTSTWSSAGAAGSVPLLTQTSDERRSSQR